MNWQDCKNILCIRPDNMGDLIMTAPALRALKETFGSKITVLTSSMAKDIVDHIPEIDDAIIFDLPWVKTAEKPDSNMFNEVVSVLRERNFDAAVIFTVYSQNPLPAAMLAYLAGVPKILAYCRENPYHLITDWVPDKEPYQTIKHQVRRDLDLAAAVGAFAKNEDLHLDVNENLFPGIARKLCNIGMDMQKPWLILHAGVSEEKRRYPLIRWAEAAEKLISRGYQIILTGSAAEKGLTDKLERMTGKGSFSAGGLFTLDEYICLVGHAPVMISVNTGTVHIAAATGTPVLMLYAQTNPQHTPWNVPNVVLPFAVPVHLQSRNQVVAFVTKAMYSDPVTMPSADDIADAAHQLLNLPGSPVQPFREIPNENQAIAAS